MIEIREIKHGMSAEFGLFVEGEQVDAEVEGVTGTVSVTISDPQVAYLFSVCEPCEFHILPMAVALFQMGLLGQRTQFLLGGVLLLRQPSQLFFELLAGILAHGLIPFVHGGVSHDGADVNVTRRMRRMPEHCRMFPGPLVLSYDGCQDACPLSLRHRCNFV
jgi:hypothetical protein